MKILIVCEHFSPDTGARALQARKVADALHDAGCEVRIICGTPQGSGSSCPYEVEWLEAPEYGRATSVAGRVLRRLRYERDLVNVDGPWVRAMAQKVMKVVSSFGPDIIMTQSTPFRTHLIGLHLPSDLRKRWVCYFSDLWPLSLTPAPYRTRLAAILRPIQTRALRRVLSASRLSISTNHVCAERLLAIWRDGDRSRCHVIAHIGAPVSGVVPEHVARHYKGRFVHVGRLTRERFCPALLDAIARLHADSDTGGPGFAGLTFVGKADRVFEKSCADLVKKGAVEFAGDVSPSMAQDICQAASTLVVIEAPMNESPFLPSKFCDYAVVGKPILAISPPGPIRRFLEQDGGGLAVGHDADEIYAAMRVLASGSEPQPGNERLGARFGASRIAQQYIAIFRSIL